MYVEDSEHWKNEGEIAKTHNFSDNLNLETIG
jgi:hypothetical protein